MYSILSVDDEPANQKLITMSLEKDFRVRLADSGESALRAIESEIPDLLLLDVNMPLMNGLQACQRIRESVGIETLPIIFVSALTSLEDKLNGYAAGGNDYIGKPIQIPELVSKINLLIEQKEKYQQVRSSLDSTREAMFSAINYAGELGSVIQFFERGFGSEELSDLANAVFSACSHLGLSVSIQFRTEGRIENYSSIGVVTPLEQELLTQAQYGDRIITHGKKSLYNAASVTIMAKNMPLEDADMCGRIRDHLAIVLRACELQIELICARKNAQVSRNHHIDILCQKIAEDLSSLNEMLDHYQQRVAANFTEFRMDFEETAIVSDISKDQLDTLMGSLGRLFDTHKEAQYQKDAISDLIADITETLSTIKE